MHNTMLCACMSAGDKASGHAAAAAAAAAVEFFSQSESRFASRSTVENNQATPTLGKA